MDIKAVSLASNEDDLAGEDKPICWICLDVGSDQRPLTQPCRCPRYCHSVCIARWQLQSAGSRKENFCDFCQERLPDWRNILTPPCGCNAPAVMNVNFNGRTYSFEVKPGPDGYKGFTEAIRRSFDLPSDSELNITFTCDEPSTVATGSLLTLHGSGAYDAAVHCASVSAARRMSTHSSSRSNRHADSLPRLATRPTPVPALPETGSEAGDSSSAASSLSPKSRRLMYLGKKLRSAFSELLAIK